MSKYTCFDPKSNSVLMPKIPRDRASAEARNHPAYLKYCESVFKCIAQTKENALKCLQNEKN